MPLESSEEVRRRRRVAHQPQLRNRRRLRRLKLAPDARALAKSVSTVVQVPLYDLMNAPRGSAKVVEARQLAMYLMYVHLGWDQPQIAILFERDAATVSLACRHSEDRRDVAAFEAVIARIESLYGEAMRKLEPELRDAA